MFNRKKLIFQFINILILALIMFFAFYELNTSVNVDRWTETLTFISLLLMGYQIIIMLLLKIKIIEFRFSFVVFSFVFLFGQIWLLGVGKEEAISWTLILRYPDSLLYEAGIFCLAFSQAIFIGLIYEPQKNFLANTFISEIDKKKINILVYKTGIILFFLALPFKLFTDFSTVIYTQSRNSFEDIPTLVGPIKDLAILMIPGIIFIIASKYKTFKFNFVVLNVSLLYCISIMILTGDRRYFITAIIAILFTFIQTHISKLNIKVIALLALFSIPLINLLTIISDIRQDDLTGLGDFFLTYGKDMFSLSKFSEVLGEFGLTFISLVIAFKYIPETIPFQDGFSFWGAIPSLLPVGWLFGDFFTQVSISKVLNSLEGYPVGGALVTELYANFGWLGIGFAVISGVILSTLFNFKNKVIGAYAIASYYSLFYILINIVRSSTMEMLRQSFIVYLAPIMILFFLYNSYVKKKKNVVSKLSNID